MANNDAKVDAEIFEQEASLWMTIYCSLSSDVVMNYVTILFFASAMAFVICSVSREFMVTTAVISCSMAVLFSFLLIYRFFFKKF